MNGEPPEALDECHPAGGQRLEQRLQVDLRIRNPNDAELAVTGIDFRLDLNGKSARPGLGNKEFARLSDAVTSVETSTSSSLRQVVRQLLFSGVFRRSVADLADWHVTGENPTHPIYEERL